MVRMVAGLAVALSFSLVACGGDEGGGGGGGGDGGGGGGDRAVVEKAALDYIVEEQSDEDDTENPEAISFESADVSGEQAEVKATSSLTGNKYEATLSEQGGSWRGQTLLTDRPSEPTGGGGDPSGSDPSGGDGKEVPTTELEQQIKRTLLAPLRIDGEAECPPTVKLRRGNNFECRVTGKRKGTVEVTQKNDQGALSYKIKFGTK